MFHRVADSAPVCSNLQKFLLGRGRERPSHALCCTNFGVRRWQTTVGIQTAANDDPSTPSQSSRVPKLARERGDTYIRHWRPHKTAELGIDVLGRPAEVFILPSRDRRITQAPVAGANDASLGIQESLASEFQPISREEVRKNIEDIKNRFGQDAVELTTADWQEAKRSLASGFTKKQLQGYVVWNTSGDVDRSIKDDHELDGQRKLDIATDILENVWKFRLVPEVDIVHIGDNPSDKHTKQIQVSSASLDLALLDKKQPLRDIAEKHHVQLDVFRQQGKIELHGDQHAVSKAQRQLRKLLDSFVQKSVVLDADLQHLLNDEHTQDDFLNMLMQKHTVKIDRQLDKLHVLARNIEQINLVRRDLLLATEVDEENLGFHAWQTPDLSKTIVAPVYPPSSRSWFSERLDWHRHTAKTTGYRKDESLNVLDPSESKAISQSIFERLASAEENVLKYYSDKTRFKNTGPQTNSYILNLGQVLVTRTQTASASVQKTPATSTKRSSFLSEIPYLPQTLAKLTTAGRKTDKMSDLTRPSLIRIRLRPLHKLGLMPSFELLLTGKEGGQGLRQPLQIHKVSAILNTGIFDLLLPTQAVDIRISKISTCELFDRRQSLSDTRRLRLLQSFAGCVDKLQNSEETAFDPILKLDLSDFIDGPVTLSDPSAENSLSPSPDAGLDSCASPTETITSSHVSGRTPLQHKAGLLDYIVEPPEVLDTRLYQLAQGSSSFLEHTFADTESPDVPRHQELLQVVHRPTSHFLTAEKRLRQSQITKEGFNELLEAAVNMVTVLGNRGRTVKQKNV